MRLRVLFVPLVVVSIAVACAHTIPAPSPPPLPVVATAKKGADRCQPWVEPKADAGSMEETYPTSSRREAPEDPDDVCQTADSNLARSERLVLTGEPGRVVAHEEWNRTKAPLRFDQVSTRLALSRPERKLLGANGFVVRSQRGSSSYAWALHDVYQSQLPVYVSADAILHAVYTSNDHLIADIEKGSFAPTLGRTLAAMHCAVLDGKYPADVAHDVDLYLTVARSLLADAPVASVLGTDAEAAKLVAAAKAATGLGELELFGRPRLVDWSQYEPRGHYVDQAPFFRAGMWLGRLEFNLVSRSSRSSLLGSPDPRETPREAVVALALADTAERAGVLDDLGKLDRTWTLLAGRREDISLPNLAAMRRQAGIGDIDLASFDKLKAAIGQGYQRTTRFHPMPEGVAVLPAITTFLGPRIVADATAFRPLVHSEISERYVIGPGDVAYVLGSDRGKSYLARDLAKFPALGTKLDEARKTLAEAPDSGDLYGAWLGALRGAASVPAGIVPSFMRTTAYDDLRVNTLVGGYGQIRHNYVLIAAQAYDEGGCEIPDGWVEPLPAVYDGIVRYADRGAAMMTELDPKDEAQTKAYFANLKQIASVLGVIARHELEGRALSVEEQRFLAMIIEMTPGGTGGPPRYTGWYFDLYRGRWQEALSSASFIADYYTSSYTQRVAYAGASGPRLGVFVIDSGGPPRLAVGPVARAYGTVGPLDKRYNDESNLDSVSEPWAASYTAPSPKEVAIAAGADLSSSEKSTVDVHVRAGTEQPMATIELLDHHGVVVSDTALWSLPAKQKITIAMKRPPSAEGIRVRIGDFAAEDFTAGPSEYVRIERGGVVLEDPPSP